MQKWIMGCRADTIIEVHMDVDRPPFSRSEIHQSLDLLIIWIPSILAGSMTIEGMHEEYVEGSALI